MKTVKSYFSIFGIILALSACSGSMTGGKELQKANTGKEIVSVNGTSIREGYLDMLGTINPKIKAQLSNPGARKQLLENLVEQELLYQESLQRGLNKNEDVAQKMALYDKIIVSQALLDDEITQRSKKYYEEKLDDEFTKVKIAQIQASFLPEDDKAPSKAVEPTQSQKDAALAKIKLIQDKVKSGEDFAKLAEELSDDKATRKKGGEIGLISKNDKRLARRNLDAFGIAAFSLKNGDVSEPIETRYGYHLIKVLSDPETITFDDAEKLLRFQIQKEVKDELVGKLTKTANIKYTEGEAPQDGPKIDTVVPVPVESDSAHKAPDAEPVKEIKLPKEEIKFKPVLKTETNTEHEGHNH